MSSAHHRNRPGFPAETQNGTAYVCQKLLAAHMKATTARRGASYAAWLGRDRLGVAGYVNKVARVCGDGTVGKMLPARDSHGGFSPQAHGLPILCYAG